jgi:phosphatidylglycerophosphatase A
MRKLFLTFFYSGLSPKAPGTMGTLASAPFGLALLYYFGVGTLALATIALSIVAIKEINKYEAEHASHDDSWIVIDETVGIWLTFVVGYSINDMVFLGVVGFLTFRAFDILKPSIIGRVDREMKGGSGVVVDDLLAGVFAGISTQICWNIWQNLL